MTIQELIKTIIGDEPMSDDLAMECFFAIAGALRTRVQGEASTFEGECAGIMAVMDKTGIRPDASGLKRFMEECPHILAIEIPDAVLRMMAEADDEEPGR